MAGTASLANARTDRNIVCRSVLVTRSELAPSPAADDATRSDCRYIALSDHTIHPRAPDFVLCVAFHVRCRHQQPPRTTPTALHLTVMVGSAAGRR